MTPQERLKEIETEESGYWKIENIKWLIARVKQLTTALEDAIKNNQCSMECETNWNEARKALGDDE